MLKRIRMINCQSWKDSVIELASDKVNVIAAPNNVGKSVLFKFLKITASPKYYNADDRKQLIRWGCKTAGVFYEFDEGFGYVKVLPTGVIYGYARNGESIVESKTPNPEMLRNIGLLTSDTFIANIIDTEQDLLLINPALRANADLMQLLVFCEDLDNVRDKVERIQSELVPIKSSIGYRNTQLDKEISSSVYVDVDRLSAKLDVAMVTKDIIYKSIIPVYKKLRNVGEGLGNVPDFKALLKLVSVLEKLEQLDLSKAERMNFDLNLVGVVGVLAKLDRISMPEVQEFDKDLPAIMKILESLQRIKFIDVKEFDTNLDKVVGVLERIDKCKLDSIDQYLNNAKEALKSKEELNRELANKGEVYECPIYGKVVYDGKECVSCDN